MEGEAWFIAALAGAAASVAEVTLCARRIPWPLAFVDVVWPLPRMTTRFERLVLAIAPAVAALGGLLAGARVSWGFGVALGLGALAAEQFVSVLGRTTLVGLLALRDEVFRTR